MHQSADDLATERTWIRQAQRDPQAFAPLYEKYYAPIFRYLERRTDRPQLAADLTAQVFLKALRNLSKYRFRGVPFSAWLFRIAANAVAQHYRQVQRSRIISLEDRHLSLLLAPSSEDAPPADDPAQLVARLLSQLTPAEVELLELHYLEERPYSEVAQILGITEGNAKVRTHRVMQKLRKLAQAR